MIEVWFKYACEICGYSTAPTQSITPYDQCPLCRGPWRAISSDGRQAEITHGEERAQEQAKALRRMRAAFAIRDGDA